MRSRHLRYTVSLVAESLRDVAPDEGKEYATILSSAMDTT